MEARSSFRCPKCGTSDVAKVAIAHEQDMHVGVTQTAGVGVGGGGLGVGVAQSQTTSQSLFAARLEPPKYAAPQMPTGLIVLGVITLLCLSLPPLLVIIVPLVLFTGYPVYKQWRADEVVAQRDHAAAMAIWERNWICRRCGHVEAQEGFAHAAA